MMTPREVRLIRQDDTSERPDALGSMTEQNVHLELRLKPDDEDPEQFDRFTRSLLSEVREHRVESAELMRSGSAPPGSKGLPEFTPIGIVATVGSHLAWDLLKHVFLRLRHRHGATIRFEGTIDGRELRFEGGPDDFDKLLVKLGKPPIA